MSVAPEISRAFLRDELKEVRDYGKAFKWGVIPNLNDLSVIVTMYAHNGDPFIVSCLCDNYKEVPAIVDFIDPETGEIGTPHAFPKTSDSLFHTNGPCICAPFNRKAYKHIHTDWKTGDWMNSTANNYDWSHCSKLVGMLALIQTRLSKPDWYQGRMG